MKIHAVLPVLGLTLAALLVVGCQSGTDTADTAADAEPETQDAREATGTIEWDYTGDEGPANWAELDSAYAACGGMQQSPIDLAASDEVEEADVTLDYAEASGSLVDTGHGVQVNIEGGTLTVGGKAFDLVQFHFHTPSEHTMDGTSYPAEVHLVHAAEDGELAVLGIFFEEGAANEVLAPVWEDLSSVSDLATADPIPMNVADMLPENRTTFTYAGSLTTPPCSEVVRWHVMQEPLTMSAEQLATLTAIYDNNNRPVQPLNDREIDRVSL
jgi:carbonic anhydrase